MDNPTGRAPLLSDNAIWVSRDNDDWRAGGRAIRDWYEAKITSGELRVVKKATYTVNYETYKCCSACEFRSNPIEWGPLTGNDEWKFCPGCGAQIVP